MLLSCCACSSRMDATPQELQAKIHPFSPDFLLVMVFCHCNGKPANAQGRVVLLEKKLHHLLGSQEEYRVLFPQFLFQAHTIGVRLPFPF